MRIHQSLREIPRAEWDALAASAPPFLSYAFLDALENCGCVGGETGWRPLHLSLWENERLVAAAPAYLKGHSEGEFVFDYAWADFAQRMRLRYYPKLILAVPFTPATGPRVLVRDESERERMVSAVAEGLRQFVAAESLSGAHVLFPSASEASHFESVGFVSRFGIQYQWHNQGYATFDDFLATFSSKKRNQIKRERRELEKQGLSVTTLRGDQITEEIIDKSYEFYTLTVDKFRWGRRYLNRAFFGEVCQTMKDNVEIVLARESGGRIIAGAFNFADKTTLYGRYWGATVELPFLHFNVCYYHSIEQCILRKVLHFEPGAGGEHKRARGFVPTMTHSVHHLREPRLAGPIAEYLGREREYIQRVANGEEEEA